MKRQIHQRMTPPGCTNGFSSGCAVAYTLKLFPVSTLYQPSAFFRTVPPRKIKARAPSLLSESLPFGKQDIWLMANYCHAICHQLKQHEVCLVSWSSVRHTRSVRCNTNLIVLPLSTTEQEKYHRANKTGCWIRVISVFCQVSTGHISI